MPNCLHKQALYILFEKYEKQPARNIKNESLRCLFRNDGISLESSVIHNFFIIRRCRYFFEFCVR